MKLTPRQWDTLERLHRREPWKGHGGWLYRSAAALRNRGLVTQHNDLSPPYLLTDRGREALAMHLAWALPKDVAYWAAIRVMAHATTGQYGHQIVPELKATDALKRWETA